jgi:hypothetical protein
LYLLTHSRDSTLETLPRRPTGARFSASTQHWELKNWKAYRADIGYR